MLQRGTFNEGNLRAASEEHLDGRHIVFVRAGGLAVGHPHREALCERNERPRARRKVVDDVIGSPAFDTIGAVV